MSKTIFKNGMPYIVEDDYEEGQTIEDVTPEDKASINKKETKDTEDTEDTKDTEEVKVVNKKNKKNKKNK